MCPCRLAHAALYSSRACLAFVDLAKELQEAMLSSTDAVPAKLLNDVECLLEEACCFLSQFSARCVPMESTMPSLDIGLSPLCANLYMLVTQGVASTS